jgi:hypothetical protein
MPSLLNSTVEGRSHAKKITAVRARVVGAVTARCAGRTERRRAFAREFSRRPAKWGDYCSCLRPSTNRPAKSRARFVNWDGEAIPFFGLDVRNWQPGTTRRIDDTAFGFPLRTLSTLPPGEYRVQALLNRYETFRRGDGRVLELPPDRGEGQQWRRKPGNLYSKPITIRWRGAAGTPAAIALDLSEEIPPVAEFKETPWVEYVRIRSERLSKFWGRDTYSRRIRDATGGFRVASGCAISARHQSRALSFGAGRLARDASGSEPQARIQQAVQTRRLQPYSAATVFGVFSIVDRQRFSACPVGRGSARDAVLRRFVRRDSGDGPYGDAIQYELIPEIERRFRGIGQGWARFVYGGSTGGWIAMAVQMFYPDDYNGAWIACPDPIDFRHYLTVDIYADRNAYFMPNRFKRTPRPAHRNWLGHVDTTLQENNLWEYALGTRARSGDQFDVWECGVLAGR